MQRLLIIYNPHSSRFSDVEKEVLAKTANLHGYIIGKYKIKKGNVDTNAAELAKVLRDGDLVISAGGDATGAIAANAILNSEKDITLGILPYGNFNDLAHTLHTKNLEDVLGSQSKRINYYPLEIIVDDKLFRYATCYVTIGMMAEAVKIYDQPKMRKVLKTKFGRKIGSYTNLAKWYFKNRHKKQFLPIFKLNGALQPEKTSDYAAVNGQYMARVMKGGEDYKNHELFRSETDRLTSFWRLFKLMIKSIFKRVPGDETKGDILEFVGSGIIEIQAEGEYETFKNVQKIKIRKSKRCLKVIKN